MGCYVKEYPEGCFESDDCISHIIAWVFGGIPLLFTMISLPVINATIFCFVRKTLSTLHNGETRAPHHAEHIREVATQGVLYVCSFYVCFFPALLVKAAESFDIDKEVESDWYFVMVLNALLPPLQGVFNALVYLRPSWVRLKKAYPGASPSWYMQELFLDLSVPPLASIDRSDDLDFTNKGFRFSGDSRKVSNESLSQHTRNQTGGKSRSTSSLSIWTSGAQQE